MTTSIDARFSPKLLNALAQLPKLARQPLGDEIIQVVQPKIETLFNQVVDTDIRPYPPQRPKGEPRIWSNNPIKNAKGRKWYFANIGEKPYQRTGELAKAWEPKVIMNVVRMTLRLSNPTKGASYVYGSKPYDFEQVPMHSATGHIKANVQGAQAVTKVRQEALVIIEDERRKQIRKTLRGEA